MDPSATSLMGLAGVGHRAFLVEHLADTFRADAWEMMHMTKTMDSIIMAMSDLHGVGDQCGQVAGGEPQRGIMPEATICLEPIHAMSIIETYTQTIIMGC